MPPHRGGAPGASRTRVWIISSPESGWRTTSPCLFVAAGRPLAYASLAGRERIPAYQQRAFDSLRQAVEADERDPQALLHLAELYKNRGDEKSAILLYEGAMRLDPAQVAASVALGAIQADRGQWKEVIRLFNDALSKNPALPGVRTALAMALLQVGGNEAAHAASENALEFDPTYTPAYLLLQQLLRSP